MSREFLPAAGGKIAPKYNLDTVKKCVSQFEQPSKNFRLHSSEQRMRVEAFKRQFLFNKSPKFHDFFSLQFESVYYSKPSSIEEFTVYALKNSISKNDNPNFS